MKETEPIGAVSLMKTPTVERQAAATFLAGALLIAISFLTNDDHGVLLHLSTLIFRGGLVLQAPIVASSESRLIPRLGVGYRYDVNGNSDEEHGVTGGFVDPPETGEIDAYGQNSGSNDLDVSLGLEYEVVSNTAIYSNIAGSFWSNGTKLTCSGGFRYSG